MCKLPVLQRKQNGITKQSSFLRCDVFVAVIFASSKDHGGIESVIQKLYLMQLQPFNLHGKIVEM